MYEIDKTQLSEPFHHPTHCIHISPVVCYVAFIGASGTRVGSCLKGNFHLGGGGCGFDSMAPWLLQMNT